LYSSAKSSNWYLPKKRALQTLKDMHRAGFSRAKRKREDLPFVGKVLARTNLGKQCKGD
jgi:hypothetical protein